MKEERGKRGKRRGQPTAPPNVVSAPIEPPLIPDVLPVEQPPVSNDINAEPIIRRPGGPARRLKKKPSRRHLTKMALEEPNDPLSDLIPSDVNTPDLDHTTVTSSDPRSAFAALLRSHSKKGKPFLESKKTNKLALFQFLF